MSGILFQGNWCESLKGAQCALILYVIWETVILEYKLPRIAQQFDVQHSTGGHLVILPELVAELKVLIEATFFVSWDWKTWSTNLKLDRADGSHILFLL